MFTLFLIILVIVAGLAGGYKVFNLREKILIYNFFKKVAPHYAGLATLSLKGVSITLAVEKGIGEFRYYKDKEEYENFIFEVTSSLEKELDFQIIKITKNTQTLPVIIGMTRYTVDNPAFDGRFSVHLRGDTDKLKKILNRPLQEKLLSLISKVYSLKIAKSKDKISITLSYFYRGDAPFFLKKDASEKLKERLDLCLNIYAQICHPHQD